MKYKLLKEFCDINMGQSPDSKTYNEQGYGLPFYQGNADFGKIHPKTRIWCSEPVKKAEAGDILISVRAPIGAMNIANEKCCIGRGVAALTPKEECDKKYLYYALESKVKELMLQGTGSTFKAINKKILEQTHIPKYDIDKQRYVAHILGKVDLLIDKKQQQIEKISELVKSRFIELFGDVIYNDKKWECKRFSDITTSRLGKMLDTKHQTGTCQYPYLANFNVQWFRFELNNLNEMDFDEKEQVEFCLKDGDLLVCEGGEIGRCAVWHSQIKKCFFQKALHRVRCNQKIILPDYLSWWFKYNCDNGGFSVIEGAKATISHLTGAKMKVLNVVVPPIELQEQFVVFLRETDKSKLAVQKSLDELETLKKSLMQEYFG